MDGLFAPARFRRGFAGVELCVEVALRGSDELLEQGGAGDGSLLGAVVAERFGLALRFENEGSEPGRKAVREVQTSVPRIGHSYF